MKLSGKIIIALALLAAVWGLLISTRSTTPEAARIARLAAAETNVNSAVTVAANSSGLPPAPPGKTAPLLGETILRDYANTNLPPQNDLALISRLMDNFTLLVKSAADRPLSANEDWAAAFRGLNPARERFLPDQHIALNAQGQLVDRWKTPLFFHALGGRRFELRSAGPDKKLWTDDDIHRNADGSFRRGAELNPPSLL